MSFEVQKQNLGNFKKYINIINYTQPVSDISQVY